MKIFYRYIKIFAYDDHCDNHRLNVIHSLMKKLVAKLWIILRIKIVREQRNNLDFLIFEYS